MLNKNDYERPYLKNEGRPLHMQQEERIEKFTEDSQQDAAGSESVVVSVIPAQDEGFESFIIRYNSSIHGPLDMISDPYFQMINDMFAILYVPRDRIGELEFNSFSYTSIPKCYTHMDVESLSASNVTRLQNHPFLQLRGKGTLAAVIDSGIDYRHPAFRDGNSSKILYLWDQTIPGGSSELAPFGRVFTKEEIDQALSSEDALEKVPSVDTNGHGTMLAGVAAGNQILEENFSGTAPEASLIVVKVKPAKQYLREFFLFSSDGELYQEDDIMLGISFAVKCSLKLQMPLSVCLGLGTSQGAHLGDSPLSQYISSLSNYSQNSVAVAAGNEGTARHHYSGQTNVQEPLKNVELRIGKPENQRGFSLEFWGNAPEQYRIAIQSPTGERIEVGSSLQRITQELSFVFVETKVLVNYIPIERRSGSTLVFFRFLHPAEGIWKFLIEGRDNKDSEFHMWLPVRGMISDETYFLESSPYLTVTSPGDAMDAMTATAYQQRDGSLYLQASRGFLPDRTVKPDFALPGVGVKVALPGMLNQYGAASGTSLAAAQAAGIGALMFEWAVIRENEPFFTGTNIKSYLKRGAQKENDITYPNQDWGYGKVDLYRTFELLT